MSIENTDNTSVAADHGEAITTSEGELLQLVSFVVGDEEFAVPILSVQEINRMMQITRVPQSPEYVEGVINLRGKIIPVIDLRKRFDMGELKDTADARIIVIEVANRVIGFTVDRVNEVLRINSDIVEPPPSICSSIDTDYIQGVGKLDDRLLIMLNLEKLFAGYDVDELAKVTKAAA
ncbi:Chemotaxis protein CheW [Poriferisphaera corsica]|uniref:Chemotaxis protein CheW n=1 Tax=Poriferisphaera corsica TaxID=2528020 RepID=A0A517YZ75_9BACT|nr:chemotaxis protein CheW [Poriferisphaera corsica]QDU35525.1 Chemotaxis protein CheW [Poriferisphaera corsica]